MKLLYPDSLYDLDTISCATFMYFQEDKFGYTLHPTVSLGLSGFQPQKFLEYVNNKNPRWIKSYWVLFNAWTQSTERTHKTSSLIRPLVKEKLVNSVWLIYPKTEEVLEKTKELISTFGIDYKSLLSVINVEHAFQELMSHIHFEMFLELYGSPETKFSFLTPRNVDYGLLYNYCDQFFNKYTLEEALVNVYFLRLTSRQQIDNIMLSNEKLIPILSQIESKDSKSEKIDLDYYEQIDVVAWEIFRQILSPYIDRNTQEKRVKITAEFIKKRNNEIKKLQNKCCKLAEDFKGEKNIEKLTLNIAKHISIHVESDIQDLLKVDKNSFLELKNAIFSDEKTWIGLSGFIYSAFNNNELFTVGSGIVTMSNFIAKTYKVQQDTQKTIKQNDYSLIYRLKNY